MHGAYTRMSKGKISKMLDGGTMVDALQLLGLSLSNMHRLQPSQHASNLVEDPEVVGQK